MSPHKQDVRTIPSWATRVQNIIPNTSTDWTGQEQPQLSVEDMWPCVKQQDPHPRGAAIPQTMPFLELLHLQQTLKRQLEWILLITLVKQTPGLEMENTILSIDLPFQ